MQGHNHRKMLAATFAGLRYLKIWVRPMQLHRLPVVTFLLLYTVNMKHHNLIDLMRKYCLFIAHPSVFPLKIMVTKSQMMVIIKLQHILILIHMSKHTLFLTNTSNLAMFYIIDYIFVKHFKPNRCAGSNYFLVSFW